MKDEDIQVFITCARRYFHSIDASSPLVIEPPFVKGRLGPFLEYTGIISISGRSQGVVCFTTNSDLLRQILAELHDERKDESAVRDLAGEIANTLSGNAREEFGKNFRISVPVVVTGQHFDFPFPSYPRNYVIPLVWRNQQAYLLVCLE
ncbi:MAG: chemotaxis protein CheX [Verrucomicrobia bacterium]|nr:chemotaxis protein CheX [Verrucomicrobiota bacterium]